MKYLLALFLLFPLNAYAESTVLKNLAVYNPGGLWLTQNERSAIQVEVDKDGTLVGYIAWIVDGGMQFDEKNPDKRLRSRPMCGLEIMKGLTQQENKNEWEAGKIYKADDGDIYNANAEMISNDEMQVRGYLALTLFGKTQTWKRVSSKDYPKCKPAKK